MTTRLTQIERSYADLERYEDTGRVVMTVPSEPQWVCVFRTTFTRPDLRFEVRFEPETEWNVVDFRASALTVSGSSFRTDPPRPLDLALATLFGVTSGVAGLVPKLLLPELVTARMLWDRARESERSVGDVIELHHDLDRWRITVDPSEKLISRVEQRGAGASSVIDYETVGGARAGARS